MRCSCSYMTTDSVLCKGGKNSVVCCTVKHSSTAYCCELKLKGKCAFHLLGQGHLNAFFMLRCSENIHSTSYFFSLFWPLSEQGLRQSREMEASHSLMPHFPQQPVLISTKAERLIVQRRTTSFLTQRKDSFSFSIASPNALTQECL